MFFTFSLYTERNGMVTCREGTSLVSFIVFSVGPSSLDTVP